MRRVVHIERQLSDINRGCRARSGGRAHATVPAAAPTRSIAPACAVGIELLFRAYRGLNSNIKICMVLFCFLQALGCQPRIDRLLYLFFCQIVRVVGTFDIDPFISLKLAEIGVFIEIIANILSYGGGRRTE